MIIIFPFYIFWVDAQFSQGHVELFEFRVEHYWSQFSIMKCPFITNYKYLFFK
jgi:hypothetical protein